MWERVGRRAACQARRALSRERQDASLHQRLPLGSRVENREGGLEVRGLQRERLELGRGCQDQGSPGPQEEGAVSVAL